MKIDKEFMTENRCYTLGKTMRPAGIMVHSTGTPQPNPYAYINYWNRSDANICVHAFVHKDGIIQTLPWEFIAWHSGGKANNTHISFEICEPSGFTYDQDYKMVGYDAKMNQAYFENVYQRAVDLCVYLCETFELTDNDVICHSEGYKMGIASNHGDVMHWFPKHEKNMDLFREDVKKGLQRKDNQPDAYAIQAVDWAIQNKILLGDDQGDLKLHENCTRQDVLVFLYRALKGDK